MSREIWEQAYQEKTDWWGRRPNHVLSDYQSLVPDGRVFDAGIGEGRNALFFAERGYAVEGVDLSATAVERCGQLAMANGWHVNASTADLRGYPLEEGQYALLIFSSILPFFHPEDISCIIEKAKKALQPGGLLYINVFDRDDPSRAKAEAACTHLDAHTFRNEATGMYHHYFSEEELASLLAPLSTIYWSSSRFLDLTHGEPHEHSTIEVLCQKEMDE
ncbi:class I SAM-dependent methyltransferase [Alkalicoccus chagannorensis]|uniref:class I SAM-dependent methyltransferase n=1 Tax=Alkalicoccus chagannorensis TaxID=427072 RepID=UPI0004251A64|nr:class I SAM-dependent methyltransferase [Alkalicoccus chagannorensis]